MQEKTIQTEILNYLNSNGYFAWKNHLGGIRRSGQATVKNPNRGAPDIMAIRDGLFFGIEVKKSGGVIAMHQYQWLEKLRIHGGNSIIADSLESCIEGIENSKKKVQKNDMGLH